MGAAMPFSKYNAEFNADFTMRAAFYRVCDILQLSGDREDPLTELVVTKIVELAKAGERNPEVLCVDVLAQLEARVPDAKERLHQSMTPEAQMSGRD
jgi:hypothetical protein